MVELSEGIAQEGGSGDTETYTRAWLVYLLFPRLVLHCLPGRDASVDDGESLARAIHSRLYRFRRGEWGALVKEARAAIPSSAGPAVPAWGDDERRWARCCEWAAVGELGRGMQALLSRGLAAGTPSDLVAKLRGLFRWEQTPSIGEGPLDTGVTPLRLEEKAFSEALRSGGRRSAPGPVGWRYEHLRTVLQLPGGTRSLMRVAQLLVDGQVPGPIVRHLGGASLTPLAKPNGGVRPLAVGEAVRRLTARAVCMQSKESFAQDLQPHQFAVGLKGGCELVYKCVTTICGMDPDVVVVALDLRNAYNRIWRSACLGGLRACRTELVAFAELFYRRPSEYRYRDSAGDLHMIHANEGVEQGDPFAPALFAYGVRGALRAAQKR